MTCIEAVLANSDMSVSVTTNWKCVACSKSFKTEETLNEHRNTKKHKQAEKAYLREHPESDPSSIFKSVQFQSNTSDILGELRQSLDHSLEPLQIEEDSSNVVPPQKTTLENPDICLFCNLDTSNNRDHMQKKHNFFVQDVDFVTDIKGLLTFFAQKIQL